MGYKIKQVFPSRNYITIDAFGDIEVLFNPTGNFNQPESVGYDDRLFFRAGRWAFRVNDFLAGKTMPDGTNENMGRKIYSLWLRYADTDREPEISTTYVDPTSVIPLDGSLVTLSDADSLAQEETLQTLAKESTVASLAKEATAQTLAKESTVASLAKEATAQTLAKESTVALLRSTLMYTRIRSTSYSNLFDNTLRGVYYLKVKIQVGGTSPSVFRFAGRFLQDEENVYTVDGGATIFIHQLVGEVKDKVYQFLGLRKSGSAIFVYYIDAGEEKAVQVNFDSNSSFEIIRLAVPAINPA